MSAKIFLVVEGSPGQGKSLYTARLARQILTRNKKWHLLGNPKRVVWSNLKFSTKIEQEFDGFLAYWCDTAELCKLRDVDVLWDEIATELDARNWAGLSSELKRFLSQYRKRGVDIYANTQDFSMIDARARLMITGVRSLTKILGSSDPSATKPKIKRIWGIIMVRDVDNFREINPEKKQYGYIPSFFFIDRSLIEMYDTTQDIKAGILPPLLHEVRTCGICGLNKTTHS